MKQVLLLIAIAAVVSVAVVGLTTNSKTKKVDAMELAQFEAWKQSQLTNALNQNDVTTQSVASKPSATRTTTKRSTTYQSPKVVSTSQNAAKTTTQKKGWSKAAKGTAIGAAGGAVLGAVVHKKNRALGAVIGGVIGGGGGYVIGRSMDKKDGRVQ